MSKARTIRRANRKVAEKLVKLAYELAGASIDAILDDVKYGAGYNIYRRKAFDAAYNEKLPPELPANFKGTPIAFYLERKMLQLPTGLGSPLFLYGSHKICSDKHHFSQGIAAIIGLQYLTLYERCKHDSRLYSNRAPTRF